MVLDIYSDITELIIVLVVFGPSCHDPRELALLVACNNES